MGETESRTTVLKAHGGNRIKNLASIINDIAWRVSQVVNHDLTVHRITGDCKQLVIILAELKELARRWKQIHDAIDFTDYPICFPDKALISNFNLLMSQMLPPDCNDEALAVYEMSEEPQTCPKCGVRSQWNELPSKLQQVHHCPNCSFIFLLEEAHDDEK